MVPHSSAIRYFRCRYCERSDNLCDRRACFLQTHRHAAPAPPASHIVRLLRRKYKENTVIETCRRHDHAFKQTKRVICRVFEFFILNRIVHPCKRHDRNVHLLSFLLITRRIEKNIVVVRTNLSHNQIGRVVLQNISITPSLLFYCSSQFLLEYHSIGNAITFSSSPSLSIQK